MDETRHTSSALDTTAPPHELPRGVSVLRADGSRTPLVYVSPTASASEFESVLAGIPDGFPVLGLDIFHVDVEQVIRETVEQKAARFVEMLRQVLPTGPYRLIGYSFGAYVAYEMTRQLTVAGDEVNYLGIIDTGPTQSKIAWPARRARRIWELACKFPKRTWMACRAWRHVLRGTGRLLMHLSPFDRGSGPNMTIKECLESILLDVHRHGRGKPQGARHAMTAPDTVRTNGQLDVARKISSHKRAMAAYRMVPIPVRIHLMASEDERSKRKRRRLEEAWAKLALEGLDADWLPCGHGDMMRPPVAEQVGKAVGCALKDLPGA